MASKRSILRKVMVGAMKAPSWFEGTFGATTKTTTDITPTSVHTLESVATAPAETTTTTTTGPWATTTTPTDTTTDTTTATTTDTATTTVDASMKKAELVAIAEATGLDVIGMTKTQILDLLQG